jgi:hypothetical protein
MDGRRTSAVKETKLEDHFDNLSQEAHSSPVDPEYPFGTCVDDLYSHSWSDRVGVWLWIPKGSALVAADGDLGFPARKSEIQKFGWRAQRVVRVTLKKIDGRSFEAVVKMDRGWDSGYGRGGGAHRAREEAWGDMAAILPTTNQNKLIEGILW